MNNTIETLALTADFGIAKFEKAMLENYNYQIVAQFDNEAEAVAECERLSEGDNAAMGYTLVYRDEDGAVQFYA